MISNVDQGQNSDQYQYIYPCAGDSSLHTLSYDGAALHLCCTHGMFYLVHFESFLLSYFSEWFMLNVKAARSIGT